MSTLTISEAIDHLGASHVAAIVASGRAYFGIRHRDSFAGRAHGQWLANQLDNFAAYGRLEKQADWNEVVGVLLERGHDVLDTRPICDICGGTVLPTEKYSDDGSELAHTSCIWDWFRRNHGAEALS